MVGKGQERGKIANGEGREGGMDKENGSMGNGKGGKEVKLPTLPTVISIERTSN